MCRSPWSVGRAALRAAEELDREVGRGHFQPVISFVRVGSIQKFGSVLFGRVRHCGNRLRWSHTRTVGKINSEEAQ